MRNHYQPVPKNALEELRERIPALHPYMALVLTLEPMLLRGEVTSEQYLQLAASLLASQRRPMYTAN
jgi:hypothetical protein